MRPSILYTSALSFISPMLILSIHLSLYHSSPLLWPAFPCRGDYLFGGVEMETVTGSDVVLLLHYGLFGLGPSSAKPLYILPVPSNKNCPESSSCQDFYLPVPGFLACVITTSLSRRKGGRGGEGVLISVSLRYRYGPCNKWPNAQAAEQTINKAISCVITATLLLKPTFQKLFPLQIAAAVPLESCLVNLMDFVQIIFHHNGKG